MFVTWLLQRQFTIGVEEQGGVFDYVPVRPLWKLRQGNVVIVHENPHVISLVWEIESTSDSQCPPGSYRNNVVSSLDVSAQVDDCRPELVRHTQFV